VEEHAATQLVRWEGFGRFCREVLGLEPMVLMRAFGLACNDVTAEIRAMCPDNVVDEATAAEWAEQWASTWSSRFESL
jgi:hypothetical protein